MARARPDDNLTPLQLTLEDWAKTLSSESGPAQQPPRPMSGSTDASGRAGRVEAQRGTRPARRESTEVATSHHPPATELLETPGALLTRTHLRELGLERRAVDAVFRTLPVVALPGYSRPMIRANQYRELVEQSTYEDDRVRPIARAS
jgi:hypothetical protein